MIEIDGAGPPIVFVHGLGGTSNSFQTLLGALGGFRCIRPDLPGSGRSPRPFERADDRRVRRDDRRRRRRRSAAAPAHLVGHSMGALVCQHLAVAAPEWVQEPDAVRADRRASRRGASAACGPRAARARQDGMIGDRRRGGRRRRCRRRRATPIRCSRRSCARAICARTRKASRRPARRWPAREAADLRFLRCPTLLVTGDEDAVAPPSAAQAIADKIKGAKLKVLEHCGHWTPIERPQDCARLLSEHVRAASRTRELKLGDRGGIGHGGRL